ncbi:MAG: ornithine carbamoyltransferase [Candidatus Aminicenantales bacterium]
MLEHFISIHDLSLYEFYEVLDTALALKERPGSFQNKLKNKISALIFENPWLWPRLTFEVSWLALGGRTIYLGPADFQNKTLVKIEDMAPSFNRWLDAVIVQASHHYSLLNLAQSCSIPIINVSTNLFHPCQALADFLTLREKIGDLTHLRLAYIGIGSNICHSLLLAAAKVGTSMAVATPPDHKPKAEVVKQAQQEAVASGAHFDFSQNPEEAATEADIIYLDIWSSRPQESGSNKREPSFPPFQLIERLISQTKRQVCFMHSWPWSKDLRGAEKIIKSKLSLAQDQAENRLHVQKAIMLLLVGKKK